MVIGGGLKRVLRLWCLLLLPVIMPTPSQAQSVAHGSETPEAFAQRIIEIYGPNGVWWKLGDSKADEAKRDQISAELYDPAFNILINENSDLAGKRGDADLDFDPLCQCQDGPDHLQIKSVALQGPDRAELHMAGPDCSQGSSECDEYTVAIKRSQDQWRVNDVSTKEGGSIRDMLERHNKCYRTERDDAALERCIK